ncbi:MAG: acylneuraminate cytidylyltransferase [Bacteroidota bacterium]
MTKTIAFVPARCGSKSIPGKNIRPIAGRPLLYWNLEALQQCPEVDEVYVATDCVAITDTVNSFAFPKVAIYDRQAANATDAASTESVLLDFITSRKLAPESVLLLVQATSPLTRTEDFTGAIRLLRQRQADSLLSCVRWKRFLWSATGDPLNYDYRKRPRRQDFAGALLENGAFYLNSVGNVLESGNRLSGEIAVYELPEYMAAELDEPHDWIAMEALLFAYRIKPEAVQYRDIRLFATDVDGVLTDAGMYYSEKGDELKKFNTHDGKALELMRKAGLITAIITSEETDLVARRAKKLRVDYLFQGKAHGGKLAAIQQICRDKGLQLNQVAYIGDDINCKEALQAVGLAACPHDALPEIKSIPGILRLNAKGGEGVVRELYETVLRKL